MVKKKKKKNTPANNSITMNKISKHACLKLTTNVKNAYMFDIYAVLIAI